MRERGNRPPQWRRESAERLRRAYEIVEDGLTELDLRRGRAPRPWRETADEVLERAYAASRRPSAS